MIVTKFGAGMSNPLKVHAALLGVSQTLLHCNEDEGGNIPGLVCVCLMNSHLHHVVDS